MYKFDQSAEQVIENTLNNVDQDGAAGEAEHHRFWSIVFNSYNKYFTYSINFFYFVSYIYK